MVIAFIRKLILFLIFSGAVTTYAQQQPQALFDRANEQLNSGNYTQALTHYRELENQNTISGALYLNMGITYHRLDSLGKAKYYLLKASRFEETEERAEQALDYIETQFSRQSAVLPAYPWDVATNWLQHNIGAANILIGGILLLNIGILLFISRWFIHWHPGYLRIAGITVLVLSALLIICSFYTNYVSNRYSKAVMVTQEVPVLEQPTSEASLVSQAFEGYTFTVDHYRSESEPGWAYVRMSNGQYGWIPNDEILIL